MNSVNKLMFAVLPLFGASVLNAASVDNTQLAVQCNVLAQELETARAAETVGFCKENMFNASVYARHAGTLIVGSSYPVARDFLTRVVIQLEQTNGKGCSQAAIIEQSRVEVQDVLKQLENA